MYIACCVCIFFLFRWLSSPRFCVVGGNLSVSHPKQPAYQLSAWSSPPRAADRTSSAKRWQEVSTASFSSGPSGPHVGEVPHHSGFISLSAPGARMASGFDQRPPNQKSSTSAGCDTTGSVLEAAADMARRGDWIEMPRRASSRTWFNMWCGCWHDNNHRLQACSLFI